MIAMKFKEQRVTEIEREMELPAYMKQDISFYHFFEEKGEAVFREVFNGATFPAISKGLPSSLSISSLTKCSREEYEQAFLEAKIKLGINI